MAAALPKSELVIVGGAGHLVQLEQPEAIDDAPGPAGRARHPVQAGRAHASVARPGAQPWLSGGPGTAELPTAEDTIALGAQLGGQLRAGDVVVLSGPLGAGKTVLAKGIARGDGCRRAGDLADVRAGPRASARAARVRPAMIHVDMYRLLDHAVASTCSPNSTRWTSTPISTTPSSSWSGARAWPSDSRTATSTSGSNAGRIPKCGPRSGSGAGMHRATRSCPGDRHRDARGHRGRRAARRRRIDVLAERVTVDARAHAEQLTPECACRARRRRAHGQRPGRRRGGLRPRPVHRPAGRHGHRGGLRARARHPGARRVQPRRDRRRAPHGRRAGGHRRPPPRGVLGALPRRGRASTGPLSTRRPTCRPTLTRWPDHPSTPRCSACRG